LLIIKGGKRGRKVKKVVYCKGRKRSAVKGLGTAEEMVELGCTTKKGTKRKKKNKKKRNKKRG